jgi:hypothetical protein
METVSAGGRSSGAGPAYWPPWASTALLLSGLLVVAIETTSFLVVLGLAFLLLGAYGLLMRRPARQPSAQP